MFDINEIGARLKRRRTELGLSLDEVANSVGVDKSTIMRYEAGKILRPKLPVLESVARTLNVRIQWLLGSSDDMCLPLPSNAIPYIPTEHVVPILGRIPAGYPVFAASEIEGYAPIDYSDSENYFWLRVSGDSMVNADIHDGDLVLIRRQVCADDGQIVAARVNGDEATLKRFRRAGDTVMLVPENPKYLPIPVPATAFATGDASIIGVVVELKRKFI